MENIQKNNLEWIQQKRGGDTAFLLRLIDEYLPSSALAIAVSGGLDSMALLHATLDAARQRNVRLVVFHVHHGLQVEADDWQVFMEQFCQLHQVELFTRRLDAHIRHNAQSIEDWARQGRYTALTAMAYEQNIQHIWLAQHQDDQIETYLLQQKRGAGARGLSAMPQQFVKANITWQRPWLNISRAEIAQFVDAQNMTHIEDPSNQDLRFARNVIRRDVQHMDAATRVQILDQVAQAQLQNQQDDAWAHEILRQHAVPHRAEIGEISRIQHIQLNDYSPEQQALLLRAWFAQMNWRMPTRAALQELRTQLSNPRMDIKMCWRHADGDYAVARYQSNWIAARILPAGQWFLTDEIHAWVARENLQLRARQGGERIKLHTKRPRMSLKDAYQQCSVAPMLRAQLPLIYHGDVLLYAAGIGTNIVKR